MGSRAADKTAARLKVACVSHSTVSNQFQQLHGRYIQFRPFAKFSLSGYDISDLILQIGLGTLFDENSDDFIGMLKDNVPLFISNVEQKAVFKVNEFGTEAAAVTGMYLQYLVFI